MDISELKKAGINYDHGVKRFFGKASIFENILKKFPKDTSYDRSQEDYLSGDDKQLERDVHELKGVSSNMEMDELSLAADRLITLLRKGSYTKEEVKNCFEEIESKYTIIKKALLTEIEKA